MAITPGFARAIAGTGLVFAAFLIPHILAGLTALASGALVMVSRKGTQLHARIGTGYFWAIAGLAATAAGLTTIRGARDLPVFLLGVLALALASTGRHARRHPRARPWRAWPGHAPHILAMTTSYTVMLTAILADNGKNLPLAGRLPAAADWLGPAAIAAPLIAWSLRRHRRPEPAAGPARAAGTAGPQDLSGARERRRADQQLTLDLHPRDTLYPGHQPDEKRAPAWTP
jgi:uncharacterized membrane protein